MWEGNKIRELGVGVTFKIFLWAKGIMSCMESKEFIFSPIDAHTVKLSAFVISRNEFAKQSSWS